MSSYIVRNGIQTRKEDSKFLVSAYKQDFPHKYPLFWVREELSRFTGISASNLVLGNKNYRVEENGQYSVFIGRTEQLQKFLPELADFLEVDDLDGVGSVNRGGKKWYAPVYDEFVKALSLDGDIEYAEEFRKINGYADES